MADPLYSINSIKSLNFPVMAVLKFGSIVTEGSVSLGGHTIQHSKGGMQLRTKPIPRGNPSASQLLIRSFNHQLQKGWRDLTNAQRQVWNDWAVSHEIQAERIPHNPISGHSLWMKYQFQRKLELLPFLSNPALHLATYLGPELISNGTFDSSAGWTLNPESSVHDGRLWCATTPPTRKYCTCNCNWIGTSVTFRILLNCVNTSGTLLFGRGYDPWQLLINGSQVYFVTWTNPSPIFYFNIGPGTTANVDNLSVRKVFNY